MVQGLRMQVASTVCCDMICNLTQNIKLASVSVTVIVVSSENMQLVIVIVLETT